MSKVAQRILASDVEPYADRFMSRVQTGEGCWEWTGRRNVWGYGIMDLASGKHRLAHRVSYTLHKEEIPDGILVCHSCDNPGCVNPDHLWLGEPVDNTRDMMRKNRMGARLPLPGEKNGFAKLTDEKVRKIYAARKGGESAPSIARRYGIGSTTVYYIENGRAWSHVTGVNRNQNSADVGLSPPHTAG